MTRKYRTYFHKFVLSLLLFYCVYIIYDNKMGISVNTHWIWTQPLRIHNTSKEVIQRFGLSTNIEYECNNDNFYEMEKYLRNRRHCILQYCGDVCNTKLEKTRRSPIELDDKINQKIGKLMPGNYANLISERKHFDCELLFESNIHDLPAPTLIKKPFKEIPDSLIEDYTYGGRIQASETEYSSAYRNDQWTKRSIAHKVKAVIAKDWTRVGGAYGENDTKVLYDIMSLYKNKIIGKRALVVGSETPWVESIVLALGAKHITTMEYNRIKSTHPQVKTVLPSELSHQFLSNGYSSLFDVIVSYSSIEHSGLTRYGDAPHPWGDLVAMAKNWCFLADNGMAFIGIPTDKIDTIHFNAHRYYGPLMLSHLFSNWILKFASWPFEIGGGKQVTFALEKDINPF